MIILNKIKTILFPNATFTLFYFGLVILFIWHLHSYERTFYNIAVILMHSYLWNLPFHIFTGDENNPGLFRFFKLHKTEAFLGNTKIGVFIFFIVWATLAFTAWHYLPIDRL